LGKGELVVTDDTLDDWKGSMTETMMPQRGRRLDSTEHLFVWSFYWVKTIFTSALKKSILRSLILDKKTIRVKL